jgi:stearoyl-CoA desaturase (Delta-9 desaturase)
MLLLDSAAFDAVIDWMANGLLGFSGWQVFFVILGLTTSQLPVSPSFYIAIKRTDRLIASYCVTFFPFWLWMTTGQVTKEWAAIHRKHHAKCEQAEDPHSPHVHGIKTVLFTGAEVVPQRVQKQEKH